MDLDRYVNIKQVAIYTSAVREFHEEIKELRAQAMSIKSPDWQKEIVSKSNDADAALAKIIEKYVEMQEKCDKMLSEHLDKIDQATQDIEKIKDIELRTIAMMKYIQGMKIKDIADKMYMDSRTVSRKLRKIDDFLKSVS